NHNRNDVSPDEPLRMAIQGGAEAIGMDQKIGSVEAGKCADLVILNTDGADAIGYENPVGFLLECASGRDVDKVYVGGKMVVDQGRVVSVDREAIASNAAVRQEQLMSIFAGQV